MRFAMHMSTVALLFATPFIGSGCVQQDRYDSLLSANRSLKEQLITSQDENATQSANTREIRRELVLARTQNSTLNTKINILEGDLDSQFGENEKLMRRVSRLQLGPLPIDVEEALSSLALGYSDVLTFDASQGMLRFASDFTFDLASVTLKTQARQTLAKVANILTSEAASGFEVQVVGHTDNVPIKNVGTRAAHPTNMHLAVHRAISVRDALVNEGIIPARIQVAGYGEHRPVVPNRIGGASQNRRVEIFIVPMKMVGVGMLTQVESAQIEQTKPQPIEPMK